MFQTLRTKKGAIPIVLLWTIIFFIAIVLCVFVIEQYYLNLKAEVAKDAVTMAAFSVYKNIDKEQLKNQNIILNQDMINTFNEYLAKNMRLNNDLTAKPNSIAVGKVEVENIKIFNKDDTEKYYPDGNLINYKPSMFVIIKYDIEPILKGILGSKKTVYTSAVVDLIDVVN